jgi:outer membrane protein TolC
MRFVPSVLAATLAFVCAAPHVFAQPAPSASAAAKAAPLPALTASIPADAKAPPAADTPPKPPAINVDDPLLAPVPTAARNITGFREVLSLLSNQSTSLRLANLEIERAKGQRRQSLAAALPDASASGSVTVPILQRAREVGGITLPSSPTTVQASLSISQPILAPRAWYAIGTADKAIEGSKLRAEDARRTAIAFTANAIVSVVSAERVAEINRVSLRSALERLELTKRRKRLGSGTDLDIVRAEQDATQSRGQIVSGDENLRKARESLGQIFNSNEGYGVPASFSLNDIEQAMKSACHPEKAENRTDVLAARSDLTVAERGVTDVKLSYAPTAVVSTMVAVSNEDPVVKPSWSISAVLSIPIWDGGARYGQAKLAAAQVEEAKVRVEEATVTATLEATQAQRAMKVAEQAKTISEKARDLAKEVARLSIVAFESGAGTSLDLVDSGRLLRQAELDLAVRELEVVRAKIAALLALSACDI